MDRTSGTVLLVEGDKNYADILKKLLEKNGYEVLRAGDCAKGLELFRLRIPDLILLDLNQTEDGFEFLKELKPGIANSFDVIIIIDGSESSEKISRCYDLGAGFVLRKPLIEAELKHLIKRSIMQKHFAFVAGKAGIRCDILKLPEEKLFENQRHLEKLVENMPVLMDAFDDEGTIIAWNRECEKVTGYSKAEVIGNPSAMKLFYPDADYYSRVMETIKSGDHEQEFTLTGKGGTQKTIRWSNASGRFPIPGWASWGIGIDITDQKRIQQALIESREYYLSLFEESPIAIWEKDCSELWAHIDNMGIKELEELENYLKDDSAFMNKCASLVRIGNVSKATLSLFNAELLEEFRSGWMKMFPRELHEDNIKRIYCFDEKKKSFEKELVMKKLNGEEFHAIIHCSALSFTSSKRPLKTLMSVIDVSGIKKAEEAVELHCRQLMQSDRLATLGTLSAGIAHEINNPNNVIMLNSAFLKEAYAGMENLLKQESFDNRTKVAGMPVISTIENIKKALEDIGESAQRINRIVANLKNYAKPLAQVETVMVNINVPLKAAVSLLFPMIKKTTDNFTFFCGEDIPEIKGTELRIEQVFVNVIQNACQALAGRAQAVYISSYFDSKNKNAVVEVKDEGSGIAEADFPYIMNPFFTTKKDAGGTGLGLTISSKIMDEHEGTLEFESVKGKGTKVLIKFPVPAENRR